VSGLLPQEEKIKQRGFKLVSLFFLALAFLIHKGYCTDVNLLDVPEKVGENLGISTFMAGILCSVIGLLLPIIPLLLLTRGKGILLCVVVGIPLLGLFTAMGWFPIWLLVVTVLFAGGMMALLWKGILS
jgi:hypothetical protein